jgi:hypothetical protein
MPAFRRLYCITVIKFSENAGICFWLCRWSAHSCRLLVVYHRIAPLRFHVHFLRPADLVALVSGPGWAPDPLMVAATLTEFNMH